MSVEKRTDELAVGDTVRDGRTITYVQPAGDFTAIVLDNGHAGTWANNDQWTVLDGHDLAAAKSAARREDMANRLEDMAKVIRELDMPLAWLSLDVEVEVVAVVDRFADLQAWSAAFDTPIEPGGTDGSIPVIRHTRKVGPATLVVRAQAMEKFPDAGAEGGEAS